MALEELLAQKRQIEEQIRQLRGAEIQADNAKIVRSQNCKDIWQLSVRKTYFDDTAPPYRLDGRPKKIWMSIADSREIKTVIDYIPQIISELQKLYEKCLKEVS